MENNTLFVPIVVKAMVVNDQVRKEQNFQRWNLSYDNLNTYNSPMPEAFSGNTAINWNNDPSANGVYLQWTIPHALRTGIQNTTDNSTDYPLVPNRWLIIRYSGPLDARVATGWIVESDFLDPNEGTSSYIDPFSKSSFVATKIGRKVDLTGWSESGTNPLFLNAIGAGEITFSAYQPYNENVFSIHDPLTDITDPTLSYMVSGWYSDPKMDPLASADSVESFTDLLIQLNWQVTNSSDFCNTSVYQGICYGISWDESGPLPPSNRPTSATISVGNTSIDALTALIEQEAAGNTTVDPQLLEAFQYNLLPLLDQPNGQELLAQAIHNAWFGKSKGGYNWVIIKTPSDPEGTSPGMPYPNSPIDWNDPNLTPNWLSKLNQDQSAFDSAWAELQELQWQVYRMWYTKGHFDNLPASQQQSLFDNDPNFNDNKFEDELNVNVSGSKAQQAYNQNQLVNQLLSEIPYGATAAELEASIIKYAKEKGLPDGYELKRYSQESYYHANDPVVLISGSNTPDKLTDDNPLTCRFADQLISGITYNSNTINASSMNGGIPNINLDNVPIIPNTLIVEFFFLDPNNATLIALKALNTTDPSIISAISSLIGGHKNEIGTLPDIELANWSQPWSPLYLLWSLFYYPIPHDQDGEDNWSFDGQYYNLIDKNLPETNPFKFSISGTTLLTPQSGYIFKQRLEEYRDNHPNIDPDELKNLEDFIEQTNEWDFLSQTLDGFSQQLTCKDARINLTPAPADNITSLIGPNNTVVPNLMEGFPVAFQGWPVTDFQSFRSGQFCFEKLMLVDRFGQSLELVNSSNYEQFKPVISSDMTPQETVLSQDPERFIQLSPRILQPARLDFDFVSALDDSKIINLNSDVNPVCAWILPNHIDRSLTCYDPEGIYLGELRVITNDQAVQVVQWTFAPNSTYLSLDEITQEFPHLGQMLTALIAKGPDAFSNFYLSIDETLWVVDPLGSRDDQNLSVLIGRPLALTRCRLKYNLETAPVTDPSWEYTFNAAQAEFLNYTFPIRLGELVIRNDGLIGYYLGSDYDQFNCVHMPTFEIIPPISPPYLVPIGVDNFIDLTFQSNSQEYITMLIDPRAAVHATTAFLPTISLELPSRFVEPALSAMDVMFNVGPILSGTIMPDNKGDGSEDQPSVLMPKPSERKGPWSWLEITTVPPSQDTQTSNVNNSQTWSEYEINESDDKANFSNVKPIIRTGKMRLSSSLKKLKIKS